MNVYFDASAFTSLVPQDGNSTLLDSWLGLNQPGLITSNFGWGEFVSAVSARTRAAAQTAADIVAATRHVERFDLNLKLPDAIHIAVASRLNTMLVTTDRQQWRAAAMLGVPTYNPLEQSA